MFLMGKRECITRSLMKTQEQNVATKGWPQDRLPLALEEHAPSTEVCTLI